MFIHLSEYGERNILTCNLWTWTILDYISGVVIYSSAYRQTSTESQHKPKISLRGLEERPKQKTKKPNDNLSVPVYTVYNNLIQSHIPGRREYGKPIYFTLFKECWIKEGEKKPNHGYLKMPVFLINFAKLQFCCFPQGKEEERHISCSHTKSLQYQSLGSTVVSVLSWLCICKGNRKLQARTVSWPLGNMAAKILGWVPVTSSIWTMSKSILKREFC